ncbi:MAG: US12 family protein [Planctomycetes bacterium]|nr:US12 family protein [Planctomycetota bacterium]
MDNPYALHERPVSQASVDVRAGFILKTYGHLVAALCGFVVIEMVLFQTGVAQRIAEPMLGNWLPVLGAFMLASWGGSHLAHRARSLPVQYLALLGIVVVEALIFAPLLWVAQIQAPPGTITSAAGVSLAGFAGLTLVAFVTRKDFSFLRGVLIWGGLIAVVAIVAGAILGFHLGLGFSVLMVAFAGAAILYDTSNVLHHYPEDRYVAASLQLFTSVALLFWYVLRIFLSRR